MIGGNSNNRNQSKYMVSDEGDVDFDFWNYKYFLIRHGFSLKT